MTRLARGADGRLWTVRTRVQWRNPAVADDFEHDVSGGNTPGTVLLLLVLALGAILVAWTPEQVVVPAWFVLALVLVFLFFPARWAVRRPWTVVAETRGENDPQHPPERWVGQVRGILAVRQETRKVARNIEVYSLPDIEGPLQPVD